MKAPSRVAATLLLAGPPAALAGQDRTVLEFDPCAGCKIEVSKDIVLGSDGESLLGGVAQVARLHDGRIAVVFDPVDYEFTVFSADGSKWTRVGRKGEGPGEYGWIQSLLARGDRLHLFDPVRARHTVLDRDFAVIRTDGMMRGQAMPGAVLDDSTYLMNGTLRTPERVGYALHVVVGGSVARSFDEPPGGVGLRRSDVHLRRSLAVGRDGSVWSAHRSRYRIDSWDPATGSRLRTLVRSAEWFPAHDGDDLPDDPARPPKPVVMKIREDREGLLWVLIHVADARWGEALAKNPESGEHQLDYEKLNTAFDTVLEVVDVKRGRVLASTRVDAFLRDLVGDGWAMAYGPPHKEAGIQVLQMWRLRLHRAQPPQ